MCASAHLQLVGVVVGVGAVTVVFVGVDEEREVVVEVVGGRTVRNCLMSVCFLLKSKNFAVDVFAAFLRAFAAFFLCNFFFFIFFSAAVCSAFLSFAVPARNTCMFSSVKLTSAGCSLQLAW